MRTERKSRQNSFSSTIHLSTGLLSSKKEEREHVSINHQTPGYIYARSNEFNKESSPWSNILSGTSSPSPSSTNPPPPPCPSGGFWLWSARKMLQLQHTDREKTGRDTRCRLSAKIIPWARDLENFISLFIIKLLNLNLTQSFSYCSRAGASCSAYWAWLITGIRIHPPLQQPSVGHPIQLFFAIHGVRRWEILEILPVCAFTCQWRASSGKVNGISVSISARYHCTVFLNPSRNNRKKTKNKALCTCDPALCLWHH